jgi:hypothetical protein
MADTAAVEKKMVGDRWPDLAEREPKDLAGCFHQLDGFAAPLLVVYAQDMSLDDIIKLNKQQQGKRGPAAKGAKAAVKRAPLTVKKVGCQKETPAQQACILHTISHTVWAFGTTGCCLLLNCTELQAARADYASVAAQCYALIYCQHWLAP